MHVDLSWDCGIIFRYRHGTKATTEDKGTKTTTEDKGAHEATHAAAGSMAPSGTEIAKNFERNQKRTCGAECKCDADCGWTKGPRGGGGVGWLTGSRSLNIPKIASGSCKNDSVFSLRNRRGSLCRRFPRSTVPWRNQMDEARESEFLLTPASPLATVAAVTTTVTKTVWRRRVPQPPSLKLPNSQRNRGRRRASERASRPTAGTSYAGVVINSIVSIPSK